MNSSNPIQILLKTTDLTKEKVINFQHECPQRELQQLAKLLKINQVSYLLFKIGIRHTYGSNYKLVASTKSLIVQTCIVSLKPVKTRLDFHVERYYSTEAKFSKPSKLISNILENEIEYIEKKLNLVFIFL